jgi:hypothetical protein
VECVNAFEPGGRVELLEQTAEAATALLTMLERLTTAEFARGGDGPARRQLRTYLEGLKLIQPE